MEMQNWDRVVNHYYRNREEWFRISGNDSKYSVLLQKNPRWSAFFFFNPDIWKKIGSEVELEAYTVRSLYIVWSMYGLFSILGIVVIILELVNSKRHFIISAINIIINVLHKMYKWMKISWCLFRVLYLYIIFKKKLAFNSIKFSYKLR